MPAVSWLPWSVDAFERARAERRPVLLSIVTSWSQSCREMDDTTYADDVVVRTIEESFVPVRVTPTASLTSAIATASAAIPPRRS